jgi:ribosomal protein S18 acetylase RimI-like enzyme
LFEEKLKQQGLSKVRIGVLQKNTVAKGFWTSSGFKFYAKKPWKDIDCYEKQLI